MGMITKTNLEKDDNSYYNIEGFIDYDIKKENLLVDRKKIIHPKNLNFHIEKLKISTVIIAIKDPSLENKQHLVDFCLENQIKVKTVPTVEDWYEGNFSAKQIKDINISDLLGRKPIELSNQKTKDEIENKTILSSRIRGFSFHQMRIMDTNLQDRKTIDKQVKIYISLFFFCFALKTK